MIHMAITRARKDQYHSGWWVMHPSNDAILAYCDTEEEADQVIAALNRLQDQMHDQG